MTQLSLLALAALLLGGFWLASQLQPASRGFGTHQQLGLAPCSIQVLFGVPCPSCGMTTCFAHFVRGEFASAFAANPAGLYLAVWCVGLIPWLLVSTWKRRWWGVIRLERTVVLATLPFLLIAIVAWLQRLLT